MNDIDILSALKAEMHYRSQRQAVITENIANANTPRYKAKELKRTPFDQVMSEQQKKVSIAGTHPKHMGVGQRDVSPYRTIKDPYLPEATPTGNAVSLEGETVKMTENNARYNVAANVYKKMSSLLKIASGAQ